MRSISPRRSCGESITPRATSSWPRTTAPSRRRRAPRDSPSSATCDGGRGSAARDQAPVHRVGRRDARLAVVAMLKALDAIGIVHEDGVRTVLPDGPHDVAEELARVLQLAVRIAEHHHVLDAHEVGGGALLVGAFLRELLR